MAAYFGRVEERRLAELGNQLIHKLEGRGGPLAVTIGRFLRNHADGQDELKNERLVKALQGQLPGVPDKELEALADRFDNDGSGSVSIKEMQGALNALSRGEALPEARTDPTPQIIVDSTEDEEDWLGASRSQVTEMRRSRDLVSSPKSPLYSPGTRAPPGPEGFDARLDNFLAKLSGRVAALATEAHARLPPQQRLPARAEALLRALGQRKLREAMEQHRQSDQHKLTPTQLYDALAVFRTPGQDLLHDRDARRLWDLCNGGDPEVFLRLFREHERAGQEGRSLKQGKKKSKWQATQGGGAGPSLPRGKAKQRNLADAKTYPHAGDINEAAACAEALRLRYKTSRTLVQPPIGWRKPELTRAVKKSAQPPKKGLELDRCFGFTADAPGPNLCLCKPRGKPSIVYLSAACAVVQDLGSEKTQKVFRGHTDDATCVCTDKTGTLGATGQCASTDMSPYVCVWDVSTCHELRRFGGDGSISRMACAITFFDDASHVAVVGGDDRHTLRVYELNPPAHKTGDDAVIVAPCKAGVEPPAVTGLYAAPHDSAHRFGNDHVIVSVGKGHLAFWMIDLPRGDGKYEFSKRLPTYRPHKAPAATHCVAFVPLDDAVCTGVSDGRVFVWRDFKIAHAFQAHQEAKPCRALVHARGHLFTGGGDGLVKRWRLDKGRYEMCNEFRPVSPHDVGKRSGAMRDVENAFPTSSTAANIGSNGLVRKPPVRKQHKQHEMLSGFESQRASGFTGVVDLLLHPQDDNHVVVGTGFAQVLVVDLPDGRGKKPKAELHVAGHHNSVQGIAMHNKEPIFATVGLDCLLILWDATKPIPLQVKTLREGATAVAIRGPRKHLHHHHHSHAPLEEHVAVGYNDGEVEIFAFPSLEKRCSPEKRCDDEAISCAKYSPSGRVLAIGSHDNAIYLMDASANYRVKKKLHGHSSYVKNIDWSFDSDLLQTSCGAYEIMYWSVAEGKRYRGAQDSVESDTRWQDWSLTLGFPVMGINADGSDGTDVNAVCRSRDEGLVIVADDSGHVRLFNAPVACRFAAHRAYLGHSSHCLGVGFLASQTMAASCGGRDAAVLLWKVIDGGDEEVDGEYIERPPAARPAWHEGCDITSTTDILRRARPLA